VEERHIVKVGDRYISEELHTQYLGRMSLARKGQAAFSYEDYVEALQHYHSYLHVIATYKNKTLITLAPSDFDPKEDLSEMLLIGHIYWDLVKIYDLSANMESKFGDSLEQFVKFTVGQPFQVVNSEMIRKYIKRGNPKNLKPLERAYKRILQESRRCVISTICFGDDHLITNDLRHFKHESLNSNRAGIILIEYYYRSSELIVGMTDRYPRILRLITGYIIKPTIYLFHKLVKLL